MPTYRDIVSVENEALTAHAERRYRDALQSHGQALALARNLDRPRLMAVLFNRLGQTLEADGNIQDAVIAYESGLKALRGDPDLNVEIAVASLAGASKGYYDQPKLLAVPDLYSPEVATDLGAAETDPALPVKLLVNVGNAYLLQPQEGPALNAYEQALARPEMAGAPALRAHALTHVGIIRQRRGETDAAAALLDEALSLLDAHADPVEKRRALPVLAGIRRARGQIDEALDTFQQALTLYAQADDPRGEGRTRAGLGHLYLELGRFPDAQDAFERAVELAEQVDDPDTLWHALWGLGHCRRKAGDLDAAADAFQRSLRLIHVRQWGLRTDQGKVTFLESVQGVFDQLIGVHLDRARADPRAYADALAVAEQSRGRALHDLLGARRRQYYSRRRDIRPDRLRPFDEQWNMASQMAPGVPSAPDLRPMIQAAPGVPSPGFRPMAQMAPGVPSEPPVDLASLLGDVVWHETKEQAWGIHIAPGAVPRPYREPDEAEPAPEDEQALSPPPVARLAFHVLDDRTAVFAVTPAGDVRGHVAAWGRDAIAERVAQLRRVLAVDHRPRGVRLARDVHLADEPAAPADPDPQLRELYAELIAPVADALPADGTPVVVEPHAALWLLPFAALRGSDGAWLADRWPLLYTPSAQVLDEIRREPDYGGPRDLSALVVGNPTMPAVPPQDGIEVELKPLPGAEREAQAIASLFESRSTVLLGPQADLASVVARIPQHGILHLATHGIAYAENPLASFVALGAPEEAALSALKQQLDFLVQAESGDGRLTARQVMSLPVPADLVVLSACQTGLGKVSGDGMIGLSRAFLVAGARAVLVSQWSVSDEATAALMAAFYQGYIELDNKALALQRAMRELRAQPEYAHPRYWAPFVVVGAEA